MPPVARPAELVLCSCRDSLKQGIGSGQRLRADDAVEGVHRVEDAAGGARKGQKGTARVARPRVQVNGCLAAGAAAPGRSKGLAAVVAVWQVTPTCAERIAAAGSARHSLFRGSHHDTHAPVKTTIGPFADISTLPWREEVVGEAVHADLVHRLVMLPNGL